MNSRKKFVVIEGLDGSGKSTQIDLLQDYLKSNNIAYKYLHFPRTDSQVYGELIAMFLQGKFGALDKVDPYLVALLYAGDRKDAAHIITEWKDEGFLVLVDRYVCSNIAFQCAKLKTLEERKELRDWILHLEYTYHSIPSPDINILLTVPFEFTRNNLTNRRSGDDRTYLNGADDIHEANLEFQKQVREVYLWQLELEKNFLAVDCTDKSNQMLDKHTIHSKVVETFKNQKLIPS